MEAPDGWEDRHDWFVEQAGEVVDLAADVEAELDEARREEMARARAEGADEAEAWARGMVAPNYRAPVAWQPVSAVLDAVDDRIEEARADC